MRKGNRPTVLFETEGSYPYSGGGVSTWTHIICSELEEKVDFKLLALTGSPYVEERYRLPSNINEIIHIPLWGTEEPVRYYYDQIPFSDHIERKSRTTSKVIENHFYPVFRDFLDCLMDPFKPADHFGEIIYGLWKYFQYFDYKKTMSSPLLWTEFKSRLLEQLESREHILKSECPRLFDITFGMRWLYHFMMPLAVPVPKVSITHSTLAGFPTLLSIAAKFEYGIPAILTDHGVFIRERLINVSQSQYPYFSKKLLVDLSTFVTRAIYTHADLIAPVTTYNKRWETKFEGQEEKIRAIYNGVDTDEFKPRAKPDSSEGTPTVVAAAQVFPLKDIETMIQSCHHVRKEIPDVQYILYGSLDVDKKYVEKCRALVEKLDLENHFRFGGFHNNPSMIFNEGDISILSSISEGFPYTVIESMSCGRPVVSTDVGGVSDALDECGILCKPRDAKALADGVIKLLKDDNLRLDMGQRARERVLLNFTISESVNNYYEVYKEYHNNTRHPLKHELSLSSVQSLVEFLRDSYE